jgi:hypothetical protein
MILAMHGLPRCGKDTAADLMVEEFGFYKDSFGKSIYDEVSVAFGVTVEQLQSNEWKTQPQLDLRLTFCSDEEFVKIALLEDPNTYGSYLEAMDAPHTSRFILQRWATEYRRRQNTMYWVNLTAARVEEALARGVTDIVFSDLREVHEYMYVAALAKRLNMYLRVIEVLRNGTVGSTHSSDAGLPRGSIDSVIRNDDLDEYRCTIRRTIKNIRRIP